MFLRDFLGFAKPSEPAPTKQLVDSQLNTIMANESACLGQRLVDAIINSGLFHLQPYFLSEMAEILWRLMELDKQRFLGWLQKTLTSLPVRTEAHSSVTATTQNLEEFYEEITRLVDDYGYYSVIH